MKLPDVLQPGLTLVLCGTAPGAVSAARGQYYAGPGNKFWPTLHATRLTSRLLQPAEFRELPRFGIGLTDLEKEQSGSDAELVFARSSALALREKIIRFAPSILCFNGKRAAKEFFGARHVAFGLQTDRIESTMIFVAPSTSGLARAAWDPRVWDALAAMHRRHTKQRRVLR